MTVTAPEQGFSGTGRIYDDPHFDGAQGQRYDIQGVADSFYNLLTDTSAKVKVNAQFQQYGNSKTATVVGQLGITLGNDKIIINQGDLSINGQSITTDGSYLGGKVVRSGDTITITTPQYAVLVEDRGVYLNTTITATNAMTNYDAANDTETDREALGLWGQSMVTGAGEEIDTNYYDFQVNDLFNDRVFTGISDFDNINTNLVAPTLGRGASTQDSLNFSIAMFEYSIATGGAVNGIATVGKTLQKSVESKPQ
ncbi:MAG: hypothetical protein SGJ17_09665 [Hyphomicrobiales bacterium]|nr:hypothetical protein [Hyphomicrobiales bacterium]